MRISLLTLFGLVGVSTVAIVACGGDEDSLGARPSDGAAAVAGNAGSSNGGSAGTGATTGGSAGSTGGTGGSAGSGATAGTNMGGSGGSVGGTAGTAGMGGSAAGTAGMSGTGGTGGGGAGGAPMCTDPSASTCTDQGDEWACIGTNPTCTPTVTDLNVKITVMNGLSGGLLTGAVVKACAKTDETCATPLGAGAQTTAADGIANFTIPAGATGFDGYFEVNADTYMPTLITPSYPLVESVALEARLAGTTIFTSTAMNIAGGPLDANRGHMTIGAYTCAADNDAPGVTVEIDTADQDTKLQYGGTLPSAANMATVGPKARAFLVNIPTGPATVTAQINNSCTIGSYSVLIRPGYITSLGLDPIRY